MDNLELCAQLIFFDLYHTNIFIIFKKTVYGLRITSLSKPMLIDSHLKYLFHRYGRIATLTFGGLIVLMFGVFIYIIDRPAGNILIITNYLSAYHAGKIVLGNFGFYLPTFFHIVGFSMITKSFFFTSKKSNYVIPLFWGSINILFEFGQLYDAEGSLRYFTNDPGYTIKEVIYNYFTYGVFDWLDISFAIIGVIFSIILFKLIKI